MPPDTQATLLEQLREGTRPLVWEEFFQRYWPVVYAFASRRGCSANTAQDVVQDVMLEVFKQREVFQYDPTRGRFRDWLATVVRHKIAEQRRRPSARARPGGSEDVAAGSIESGEPSPDEAWEAAFESAVVMAIVDVVRREVDPQDFVAFELTTLGEVAPADVAALTGLTRNVVYKARRRVMARVRALAGEYAAEGRLPERVRDALRMRPAPAVERALTRRVSETMRMG